MAIVKMKKFNLFALEGNRKQLLEKLQKFSFVNFVKTNPKDMEEYLNDMEISSESSYVEDSTKVQWMIDYLEKFSEKEKGLSALKKGPVVYSFEELEKEALSYDYVPDYEKVSELSKNIEDNSQQISNLNAKLKEISPWSSLKEPVKDLKNLKNVQFIMGCLSAKSLDKFKIAFKDLKYTYFEELQVISGTVYCIVITNEQEREVVLETLRVNSFVETTLDIDGTVDEQISLIKEKLKSLEEENLKLFSDMKVFTKNISKMKCVFEYYQNLSLRDSVVSNFKSTEKVDIIQGYIPADKENDFKDLLDSISDKKLYFEIEDAKAEDREVPIMLKNNKFMSFFENVTKMYALPRYNEIDPTFMLSIFYWIFFGMMVADFAYGLILFLGSGIALKMFKFEESTKKFLSFFFMLSFSTMIWGLIYGSAFGDLITLPTQLLDSSKDVTQMLILSLAFGGVHLAFGLGMKAYVLIRNGQFMDAVYDVFLWYLTLVSVIVFIIGKAIVLPNIVNTLAFYGMIIGMLGIIAFGARDSKSIAGRIAGGLYSLYGITSYIGDFVSYLRLMALGLAGGFIAVAINIIVKMLAGSGIIGLVFGLVIFVFAQSFNIFLSFLSAYVHTSRLMYVEFFSKFYEGGGTEFKKFRSNKKYIEVK